jgi:diguanylate cyclase (GGDEF)-like protein/PAS domain S-box-containing protein
MDAVRRFPAQWGWSGVLTGLFLLTLALPTFTFFSNSVDYALLHLVLEFASMAISLMIVALAWNLRNLEANTRVMIIGWASLGVLIIDMAHALSFPGMPNLVTESSTQKGIVFWLAGRAVAAAGFLLLALAPNRHWPRWLWFAGVAVVGTAAFTIVWLGLWNPQTAPDFFIPGEGLTPLKRAIEYVLSAAYALAAVLLVRRAHREDSTDLAWLAAAAWALTLAELYFTLYATASDVFNLVGHLFKVVAYIMVYRAIFVAGVQAPYRELARESALLRSLLDSLPDQVSVVDMRGRLLGANRSFAQQFGLTTEDLAGRSVAELEGPARRRGEPHWFEDGSSRFDETVTNRRLTRYYDTVRTPFAGENGERLGFVEVSRDITAQRSADERIHQLALFDQLTGLPNRILLQEQADSSLQNPELTGSTQAMVFLDLDDFKAINDTLGHRLGDLVLTETARRLERVVDGAGRVYRLGGDEFAVLAAPCTLDNAVELVGAMIHALDAPYRLDGNEVSLSASAGIAMYPTDGDTFDALAVRAEAAMYRAKADGRHAYRFFSGDMLIDAADRLQLLTDLRRAIAERQFVVHYQPQIRLADGAIAGLEALVRWQHPERGLVAPDVFIPLAEESGLILPLGEFVLDQALTDAAAWRAAGATDVTMAVNVSAVQFLQVDLVERVERALLRRDFPGDMLELEITESIAMANPAQARTTLHRLHQLGIAIAIDDFGTGYSSLAYLKGFAIDLLKIDQSFVRDLGTSTNDTAIVNAILDFAQALGIETVAEGVETKAQAEYLAEHGCLYGQGFWFHRPMPAEQISRLFQPVRETT